MLIELYAVMIVAVPIIFGCIAFSDKIDKKMDLEVKTHNAIYDLFFVGSCSDLQTCSGSKIKVRKPSKPFNTKNKEGNKDEAFSKLYGELEEAVKNGSKQ